MHGIHAKAMLSFCEQYDVGTVVCDLSPLRVPRDWTDSVAAALGKEGIACVQVDAHNVVPVWEASDKAETMARWIRPKLTSRYEDFLKEIPPLEQPTYSETASISADHIMTAAGAVDWAGLYEALQVDQTVQPVPGVVAGSRAALDILEEFCESRLGLYADEANDPTKAARS
eukprot:4957927-Amphidinium_carterae.1